LSGVSGAVLISTAANTMAKLKQFVLITTLVVAVSPAAAQSNPSSVQSLNAAGQSQLQNSTGQQSSGQNGPSPTSPPVTGVICMEEMTATFCNVVTGPNTAGYGSGGGSSASSGAASSGASASGGASASSAGGGTNAAAIPACGQFPPANELCN
jgi:hypothetical protein